MCMVKIHLSSLTPVLTNLFEMTKDKSQNLLSTLSLHLEICLCTIPEKNCLMQSFLYGNLIPKSAVLEIYFPH